MQEETLNKDHFVCDGECGGVSAMAGTCQAPQDDCSKAGQPLSACNCDALKHKIADSSVISDGQEKSQSHGNTCGC